MQITEIIQKTPGVSGGYACVRNTRIPVWTLVSLRQALEGFAVPKERQALESLASPLESRHAPACAPAVGATEQELLSNYPGLSLDDLTAVWGYYYNHKLEIDRTIIEMED